MKSILLLISLVVLASNIADAGVLPSDRTKIRKQVDRIVIYVNEGNFDSLSNILSPNARTGLKDEIEMQLAERNIQFKEVLIGSYKEIDNNRVRVSGSWKVRGPHWESSGIWMNFIFERTNSVWLLVDTNFHQIIFPAYILRKVGRALVIVSPLFIVFTGFWLWMLVDCAGRNFPGPNEKVIWILILILIGIIGAIAYYFIIKRKSPQQKFA